MLHEKDKTAVFWLYSINTAVLATHEIDSAYWHEWTLFWLPGGIQLFLVLNLLLLIVVLYEFRKVCLWEFGAKSFSYVLAGAGIFAYCIHTLFITLGHPEFRTLMSVALLFGTLVLSIAQVFVTRRCPSP
ncbi:MAG: hypothetical protein OER96_00750 [Gammaproteobacteria bacterium]|nr:hypothetical protein [Gammaproteobacteria bacterium]